MSVRPSGTEVLGGHVHGDEEAVRPLELESVWPDTIGFDIWIAEADGSRPRQVTSGGLQARNPVGTAGTGLVVYVARHPGSQGLWVARDDGAAAQGLVPGWVGQADISPDGRYVLFADRRGAQTVLRVIRLSDAHLVPFKIDLAWAPSAFMRQNLPEPVRGQSRFTPDGRAVAFIDRDESDRDAIFIQDFDPARETSTTRRQLVALDPDLAIDSFALSPDGRRLAVACRKSVLQLMIGADVSGIRP